MCPTCVLAAASAFGLSNWLNIQPGTQAAFLGFSVAMIVMWFDGLARRDGKAMVHGQKIIFGLLGLCALPLLISLLNL